MKYSKKLNLTFLKHLLDTIDYNGRYFFLNT
jgi:hypothetical protein